MVGHCLLSGCTRRRLTTSRTGWSTFISGGSWCWSVCGLGRDVPAVLLQGQLGIAPIHPWVAHWLSGAVGHRLLVSLAAAWCVPGFWVGWSVVGLAGLVVREACVFSVLCLRQPVLSWCVCNADSGSHCPDQVSVNPEATQNRDRRPSQSLCLSPTSLSCRGLLAEPSSQVI